jgi:hypothetical protein
LTTALGLRAACGGVLITNLHVLTAAHCVINIPMHWTLVSVRLGEYDTTTSPDCYSEGDADNTTTCLPETVSIPINRSIAYEKYDSMSRGHDLAVLQLNESVNATPICLPSKVAEPQRFHIAGWGRLAGRYGSGPKLHSYISISNESLCKENFALYNVYLANDQFCAGDRVNEFPCFGDSGGPLMGIDKMDDGSHKMAVYGILTTDSGFCDFRDWPAMYTSTFYYIDWIHRQIM